MAGYTITITPNDDDAGPQTTIRVDTASGSARITELTVRSTGGSGLSPQQLPAVNLEQLVAALAPSAPVAIAATPDPAPVHAEAAAPHVATEEVPSPAPSPRSGRPAHARTAAKTAARKPARKAPAHPRQSRAEGGAAAQATNGRRAYRRMPEADEVLAVYREVGGTTALARHYGVPRHTATGWLRRLRTQGLLEG